MEVLRAIEPLHVGGKTLIPVYRVRVESSRLDGCAWILAFVQPRAIVVGEGGRWRALGQDGVELALEPLLEEVASLADAVGRPR